jgi:type II secretory pathway component PulJ
MKHHIQKRNGFTLMEILVYISLFSLIMVFLVQFLSAILQENVEDTAREEVEASLLTAINIIDSEVRNATDIYLPTSTFSSHPGQLSLTTVRSLPADEQITYVDFFISDDERLCIRRDTSTAECLTSPRLRVTNLQFIRLIPSEGSQSIQTKLTLEYRSSKADLRAPSSIQSTANLRAYD